MAPRTPPETMLGKRSLGGRAEARKASDGILDEGTVCRASLTPPQAALPRLQPEEGFGMSSRQWRRFPAICSRLSARAHRGGFSQIELLLSLLVVSIGVLVCVSAFSGLSRGAYVSKTRTIATNLVQQKVESLKHISYHRLLVTTAPVTAPESNVGGFSYDTGYYAPEALTMGGIAFNRRVLITRIKQTDAGLVDGSWTDPDIGIKKIAVFVLWQEGSVWRKVDLQNYLENPNRQAPNATFEGSVTSGGSPLADVRVVVQQNPSWASTTGITGTYRLNVTSGTYTLQASKTGYFPQTSGSQTITSGQTKTVNFTLVIKGLGTAVGVVWKRDHLVISEVCAQWSNSDSTEYIELYNPTTAPFTLSDAAIKLKYIRDDNMVSTFPPITWVNGSIPSRGFFLIASSPVVNGVTADAYYDASLVSGGAGAIHHDKEWGCALTNAFDVWIDSVAWGNVGLGHAPPPAGQEGQGYQIPGNWKLNPGECLERRSYPGATPPDANGNAFDSNANENDFVKHTSLNPQNTTLTENPTSGTPAAGALVFADDGLSSFVTATTGYFQLPSIATGTWTLSASAGTLYGQAPLTLLTPGASIVQDIILTSTTTNGYISGRVTLTGGSGLASIVVDAEGTSTTTDPNGYYRLAKNSGVYTVTANPNNTNGTYTIQSLAGVTVSEGLLTPNIDFTLSQGGRLSGMVTSNGSDPLPGITVSVQQGALERGTAISALDGQFTVQNLAVGNYTVVPQLETGETASPASVNATVTSGSTISVGTFTVTGGVGRITGFVTGGGAPITIGVLVVASTATVSSPPPTLSSATVSGPVTYYGVSSLSDGTYTLAVPGGSPPIPYNVYAWYTTWNG
ncbi:MAG: carboxypeptidase regulatory-like domain-containing protein, partial [Elusimicrobia bacterium]|nr:carboxypeptidase regulatory-like domain-containing protein [Elusimicrobiota bacterium]